MTNNFKPGDRVRLLSMVDDPDPISAGMAGTVLKPYPQRDLLQLDVAWDNGRSLMLCIPPDRVEHLDASDSQTTHSTPGN